MPQVWVTAGWVTLLIVIGHPGVWSLQMSQSTITTDRGHYPSVYCTLTDVVLDTAKGTFFYNGSPKHPEHEKCGQIGDIWDIKQDEDLGQVACDEEYDIGHIFTIYYWGGGSNYYHLHYDMLIPLFRTLYFKPTRTKPSPSQIFMPSVETTRLKPVDWDTTAFDDESKYWVEMTKLLTRRGSFVPLNKQLREDKKKICFKKANFGIPHVDFKDEKLIKSYVKTVWRVFDIKHPKWSPTQRPQIGLISRTNRRRIKNEQEVIKALETLGDAKLLNFDGMSFHEQVQEVNKLTVLAGMNGAGLMNALYLPPNGAVIQMVPYKAELNYNQYSIPLKARGPYLEWHNRYADLNHPIEGQRGNAQSDTTVHVQEFLQTVEKAIKETRPKSKHEEL